MSDINTRNNKEIPIDEKYLREQHLDDVVVSKEKVSSNEHIREAIDFDKMERTQTNSMVDFGSLGFNNEEKTEQVPVQSYPQANSSGERNVVENAMGGITQNANTMVSTPPQREFTTNGGLTIHSIKEPEKKQMSKKTKKTIVFGLIGFACVISICAILLVLKSMGIIDKPTMDEIYASHPYNYTNGTTKFVYDGNTDVYFVESDYGYEILSTKDNSLCLAVMVETDGLSLEDFQELYDNIETINAYSENDKVVSVKHNDFNATINNATLTVQTKSVSNEAGTINILFEYESDMDTNSMEFHTFNQIYQTVCAN